MDMVDRYRRSLTGTLRKWSRVGCGVHLVLHAIMDPNAYLIITTAFYVAIS